MIWSTLSQMEQICLHDYQIITGCDRTVVVSKKVTDGVSKWENHGSSKPIWFMLLVGGRHKSKPTCVAVYRCVVGAVNERASCSLSSALRERLSSLGAQSVSFAQHGQTALYKLWESEDCTGIAAHSAHIHIKDSKERLVSSHSLLSVGYTT